MQEIASLKVLSVRAKNNKKEQLLRIEANCWKFYSVRTIFRDLFLF